MLLCSSLIVEAQVERDQELLRYLLRLLILREEGHFPQRIHADQFLVETDYLDLVASCALNRLIGDVDQLEVLLETLDQCD